jgi:hypothetical protein
MNQASNLGPATSVYFASDPRPFLDRAARPMILLAADFQMRLPWVRAASSLYREEFMKE